MKRWILYSLMGLLGALVSVLRAQSQIAGSPHDLSAVSGGNPCSFCHTPHGGVPGTPLWSRQLSNAYYQIYQSSSLQAQVGQPTGSSKLCLSCHDGTVATSESLNSGGGIQAMMPAGQADLGTDLSDDHPISFVYSAELAAQDPQLRSPLSLHPALKLSATGEVQCTTCHDAHNNQYGNFLVMPNHEAQLCTSCHDLQGWTFSTHATSTRSVVAASDPILQQGHFVSMSDAGCMMCHQSHGAGGSQWLLHFSRNEDNCLNCHNGSVATTNIQSDLLKTSAHNVFQYDRLHDPQETPASMVQHVECTDCHNPHQLQASPAQAPMVPGVMEGVSGVTAAGSPTQRAQFEYEVCFKCHADYANRQSPGITRDLSQSNVRLQFDPTGPSFHPVEAPGVNPNVPSLRRPLTVASQIYCTDCHNSDSTASARGPHGSSYPYLLAYHYETADFTPESAYSYELCYQCHSRNSILNDESFPYHQMHLDNQIPCSACHDAHGISASQGNTANHSHLINFDVSIVRRNPDDGLRQFEDLGVFHGRCSLSCHNAQHDGWEY